MRYPTSIRSAIVAAVPLLAGLGLSAQTALGAGLDPRLPVYQPVQVLQPAATTFNGTYKSPNGHFTFSLTDSGIVLAGPGGSVRIDETSIHVAGNGNVSVSGSATVSVTGSSVAVTGASTQIVGGMITLNGGCQPIVRKNDQIQVTVPYPSSVGTGTIVTSSPSVLSC